MRGKVHGIKTLRYIGGITPAYAGKRCPRSSRLPAQSGSPPRMRGKGAPFRAGALPLRITPAYAGKSQTAGTPCSSVRDHPRMCGEKLWPTCPHAPNAGSPPRMRGKDRLSGKSGQPDRITPACAEKRPARPGYAYNRGDHPRMCGKKFLEVVQPIAQWGSPPRMRGKASHLDYTTRRCRITPAYAGKRLKRSRSTVSPVAIVPLFPSVCNKPVVSDGSPAGRDAPLFLPAENAVPASPAYNLRSL